MTNIYADSSTDGSSASRRRKFAERILAQSMDSSPVGHPLGAVARALQGLYGGYLSGQADRDENEAWSNLPGLTGAQPGMAQKVQEPGANIGKNVQVPDPNNPDPNRYAPGDPARAVGGIESGGRYDALGPVTKTGDRAYGKYQVMGANIPAWTKAHLGQEMSSQQYLQSPEAQDAVFKGQFGQYTAKHGQDGAARAWFAGEGGMNNPNAKDQLGTTVGSYGQKFAQALGGASAPASGTPQIDPARAQQIQRLLANPSTRQIGLVLYQQAIKPSEYGFQSVGENLIRTNPKTGVAEVMPGMTNTKPTYGIVGEDDFGKKSYGWIDPSRRSVTPQTTASPRDAGPSTIPATPAGVDPKKWREVHTERAITDALPGSSKEAAGLRGEIRDLPSYKNFAQAAPVYKSMHDAAGRDTRAADVNMIYAMAKIMDPGSVVRESEMTVAQAVATLPQYLKANIESQLLATGRLSPEVREAIMQEAHSRISSYQGLFDQDMQMYRGIAGRGRIREDDVIPSFGEMKPWQRSAPRAADDLKSKYGLK